MHIKSMTQMIKNGGEKWERKKIVEGTGAFEGCLYVNFGGFKMTRVVGLLRIGEDV